MYQIKCYSRLLIYVKESEQIEQNQNESISCLLWGTKIADGDFNMHMMNRHTKVNCDVCGKVSEGEFDIQGHIARAFSESTNKQLPDLTVPNAPNMDSAPMHHPTTTATAEYLPRQFKSVIHPGDQEWVAQCIYGNKEKFKESVVQNWYYPPEPTCPQVEPNEYFRQRLFVWAPMSMFGIPLKCPKCAIKLTHIGIYKKVRGH